MKGQRWVTLLWLWHGWRRAVMAARFEGASAALIPLEMLPRSEAVGARLSSLELKKEFSRWMCGYHERREHELRECLMDSLVKPEPSAVERLDEAMRSAQIRRQG